MELVAHTYPGKLIVVEGMGGVGKSTQAAELAERLREAGKVVFELSMPRYDMRPAGPLIREYVHGAYGDPNAVHPKIASMLYMMDRAQTVPLIREHLAQGHIVLCTRYAASNAAYQAAKLPAPQERADFVDWLLASEYRDLEVPVEDLFIYLYAPIAVSTAQAEQRAAQSGDVRAGRDGHEQDDAHLEVIQSIYLDVAKRLPRAATIDCVHDGAMRSIDAIAEDVWKEAQSVL